MEFSRFSFPTQIIFGPGARHELPSALQLIGAKRPLFITDIGIAKLPLFQEFQNLIELSRAEFFSYTDIFGNPVKSQVLGGVKTYQINSCDSIVVAGGGAALDVAKVIALMATNPGDLFDYEDGKPNGLTPSAPLPPLIALPTASGTGSEVGRSSVISDDETHQKKIIFSPELLPKLVIADPELTYELPAFITAATGLDALTHSLEAFIARGTHPMCEGIALEAIRLISRSLVKATKNGRDPEARSEMLMAAMMGAVAFQKGLGVTHSCAHALSTVCDLHHGLANGILLPTCMRFNEDAVRDKFKRIEATLSHELSREVSLLPWLKALKKELQIPKTLSQVNVSVSKHLDQLVEVALQDGCHALNPKPVSREDFRALFIEAING